jgi:hypothetical protein
MKFAHEKQGGQEEQSNFGFYNNDEEARKKARAELRKGSDENP